MAVWLIVCCYCGARSLLSVAARKVTWVNVWAIIVDRKHGQAYI